MTQSGLHVNYRIAMLGPSGAGKTSMIAALYDQFDRVVGSSSKLTFTAEADTGPVLNVHLADLKRAAAGKKGNQINTATIQGTEKKTEYCFRLDHLLSDVGLGVTFDDYPGGWLHHAPRTVDEIIEKSRVILVAIDTPALMVMPDYQYTEKHCPAQVADSLQRIIRRAKTSPTATQDDFLVLFVGMKCERWMRAREGANVLGRFLKVYERACRVIQMLETPMAFLPIQTLGSVEFDHYEESPRSNEPSRPVYYKRSDTDYAPVDCDQPLRYALGHMFNNLKDRADQRRGDVLDRIGRRKWTQKVGFWFLNKVGKDTDRNAVDEWSRKAELLLDEAEEFTSRHKTTDGFFYTSNRSAS